jgi:hypothetical protein
MIEVSHVLEVYFFVSAHILFSKLGNAFLVGQLANKVPLTIAQFGLPIVDIAHSEAYSNGYSIAS